MKLHLDKEVKIHLVLIDYVLAVVQYMHKEQLCIPTAILCMITNAGERRKRT